MNKQWKSRVQLSRESKNFSDVLSLVNIYYNVLYSAGEYIGPYNSKQRGKHIYTAPSIEQLRNVVKQSGMNDFIYTTFLHKLQAWCQTTKGMRALPTPHPSVIHSIQLPISTYDLFRKDGTLFLDFVGSSEPFKVEGFIQPKNVKFVIVRPKLGKLGTSSVSNWEALLFEDNKGFIPDWTDTEFNPRYSGVF